MPDSAQPISTWVYGLIGTLVPISVALISAWSFRKKASIEELFELRKEVRDLRDEYRTLRHDYDEERTRCAQRIKELQEQYFALLEEHRKLAARWVQ